MRNKTDLNHEVDPDATLQRNETWVFNVSRRDFLTRGGKLAALTAMISAGGATLVACGGDDDDDDAAATEEDASSGDATEATDEATEAEETAGESDETAAEESTEDAEETSETGETSDTVGESNAALTAESDGEAQPGGVLTIVRSTDALNLHPGMNSGLSDIASNFLIYDALVIKGFDGRVYPGLAESWEPDEEGTTWTFTLRQDVKFHSGEPFTSAHVVDHFNRWKEMPTSSKIVLLDSVEATDDYTVVFKLSSPTLVFLNNISQTEWAYASIPNMKKVEELGDDYGVVEVDGTGPYKLEEWVKDDHMTLVRNEDYVWGSPIYDNTGPVYPDRLIFQVVPEEASRTALVETGEANFNIEVAPRDVSRLEDTPNVTAASFPRISSNHIGFNMERELFQDINVRKAVMHGINRQEITEFVMQGQADPAEGYLHPEMLGAAPREETKPLVEYDPEQSIALLEESGWVVGDDGIREKEGQKLSFSVYLTTELNEQINTAIQAQLREVGIDMQVKRLESAAYSDATQAGEHDARFIPMIYSSPDHMYFFITDSIPSPNTMFWSDPKFDEMFVTSQTTIDEEERIKTFQEMEMYLLEQAVVIPIQHLKWIFAWRDEVKGTKFHNIHGIYKLMDTWIG